MNYYAFLQTIANFIVKAVRIDSDKDGKIESSEIMAFITSNIVPIFLNLGGIKKELNDFVDRVKGITLEQLREDILVIVKLQLLPEELSKAEEYLDLILGGIYKVMSGIDDIRTGLRGFGIGQNDDEVNLLEEATGGKIAVEVKAAKKKVLKNMKKLVN